MRASDEKPVSEKNGTRSEKDGEEERNVSVCAASEECGQKQVGLGENKDAKKEDEEKEIGEIEMEAEMREEEDSASSEISVGERTRREIRKRNLKCYRMVRTR